MADSGADATLAQALRTLPGTPVGVRTRWLWERLLAVASGGEVPAASDLREQYTPDSLVDTPPQQLVGVLLRFAPVAARATAVRIEPSRPNALTAVMITVDGEAFRFRCVVEEAAPHRIIGHLSSPSLTSPALDPVTYVDRIVQRDDRCVHIRDFGGDGPLLLLWHGRGCDLSIWEALVPHLAGFRLVAQDMPGHGCSPQARFTMADAVADADAVIADLELSEPILVGHSMGGQAALHYGARRSCRGLICLDGPNTLPAVADLSDIASDLSALDVPTMIVVCSEPEGLDAGTWMTRRLALCEYLEEHHPGVSVEWMPTGHLLVLTMAEQTAALIRQFTSASVLGSDDAIEGREV